MKRPKKKNKAVILTVIGIIIGMQMNILFDSTSILIALIPLLGALGGLIGTIIDKRKHNTA